MKRIVILFILSFLAFTTYGQSTTLLGNTNPTGLNILKAGKSIFDSNVVFRKYKAVMGDTMVICLNDTGGIMAVPISDFRDIMPAGSSGGSDAQTLSVTSSGNVRFITISNGNTIAIKVADPDSSITNEIQALTISNDTIFLSSGGYVKLPAETDPIWLSEKANYYTKTQSDALLAGKSNTSHTHSISNVTGLQDTLNKKPDTSVTNTLNRWVNAKTADYDTITVFSNNFSSGSVGAGFIDVSNNSSYAGGKLTWTNTQDGLPYGNYIRYDQGALSENYIMSVSFKFDATTDPARGLAVGLKSLNPYGYTHTVISGYDADSGKLYFRNSSTKLYGTQSHSMNVGDSCVLTQGVQALLYTAILTDYTGGWTITFSQQLTPSGVPFSAHNTGNPVLHHVGGDYTVYNWSYKIIKPHLLDLMVLGNSITEGQAATTQNTRYGALIKHQDHISIAGGGADATYQLLQRAGEIITLNPKAVTINEGNDILFGTADSAWQANLRIIRDSLVNNGIAVIWLSPTPRNSTDMRGMKYWIDTFSNFRADLKIDLYSPLHDSNTTYGLKSIYDSGDGLHPNDWGHRTMADLINVGLENGTNYSGDAGYLPVFTVQNSLKNSPLYVRSDGNIGYGTNNPVWPHTFKGTLVDSGVIFASGGLQTSPGSVYSNVAGGTSEAMKWGYNGVTFSAGYGDGRLGIAGVDAKGRPANALDVYGSLAVGTSYYHDVTAPSNSLIVQGNVGIGVQSPSLKLEVAGNVKAQFPVLAKSDTILVSDGGTIKTVIGKITKALDTTITGDWTYSIGAGIKLISITVYTGADDTLNIGTTSGGGQILPDFPFVMHQPATINTGEVFALSSSTTIYFTGGTSSIRYILKYE